MGRPIKIEECDKVEYDYQAFVDNERSLLVAPAGYGKTYTIANCLNFTTGKQLILTHTHAGVAALKEKIAGLGISKENYAIETISSFSQKYVNAFYLGDELPSQGSSDYHSVVTALATTIFNNAHVRGILQISYSGLFVDEYQDCSQSQHSLINEISQVLSTHILGDPMQGIFDFNGALIDFESDLKGFTRFPDLEIPERWERAGKGELGAILKNSRYSLQNDLALDLSELRMGDIEIIQARSNEFFDPKSAYRTKLIQLIQNKGGDPDLESLLIVIPGYTEVRDGKPIPKGSITDRKRIRAQIDFSNSVTLLEAIDDRTFYLVARNIDSLVAGIGRARLPYKKISTDLLKRIFNKTDVDNWLNDGGIKNKRDMNDKKKAAELKFLIDSFIEEPSAGSVQNILLELKEGFKFKCARPELLKSILKSVQSAKVNEILVNEAMKDHHNMLRRMGRRINGKCIGTTLLTKGLEFDTVVIFDAHKFDSPKHLYVAITRCCRRLIIFSEIEKLTFN